MLTERGTDQIAPFTKAAVPVSICNGVTLSPWPKEIVAEATSDSLAGTTDAVFSRSSIPGIESKPMRPRKARNSVGPIFSAMRTVPMLEEKVSTSATERWRYLP